MALNQTKVCLQKTLKKGQRRCIYCRWVGEVSGNVLRAWTIQLERMYLGNTPYPIAKSPIAKTRFPTHADAFSALRRRITARRAHGYVPCGDVRQKGRPC